MIQALANTLRSKSPLNLISESRFNDLIACCRRRTFSPRSTIISEGDAPDGMYLLLSGSAKVFVQDDHGRAITFAVIETNQIVGEIGLIDDQPRSANVQAISVCEALFIPRAPFLRAIDGNFAIAMHLLRLSLERLRGADRKIQAIGLLDVYDRVANVLLENAEQIDDCWIVDVGSEEIARTVAASREMVSRVITQMRKQHLVRKEGRKTVLLDPFALQKRVKVPLLLSSGARSGCRIYF